MYVSKVAKRFKGQWNSVVTKSLNFIPSQSRTMSHARKKLKDLNKQKRELNQNDYFFFSHAENGAEPRSLFWSDFLKEQQHVCDSNNMYVNRFDFPITNDKD